MGSEGEHGSKLVHNREEEERRGELTWVRVGLGLQFGLQLELHVRLGLG